MNHIFILDDSKDRMDSLIKAFGEFAEFTWAKNYREAEEKFYSGKWDMLMLDHDLGCDESGKNNLDGARFCDQFLIRQIQYRKTPVVIHSSNPVGALNMRRSLERAAFLYVSIIPIYTIIDEWNRGRLNFLGHYKKP
jgi:CheY-like chemotaxis protein